MSISPRAKLSIKHLTSVLHNFFYTSTTTSAFLAFNQLQIIQQRIQVLNGIPINHKALCEYAVKELLTDIVEDQLQKQRYLLNVSHRDLLQSSREQFLVNIQSDIRTNAQILIQWSLLYHLYIQVDLNLSFGEFAALTYLDTRTLRRYKQQAIQRLWSEIVQMEVATFTT